MKTVVIGGGLIGLTTAYALATRGHEVIVIDRQSGPGLETSFANGALLTPSMSEPWNSPGSWRVLLASLGRSDTALELRLRTLPSLAGWGIRFLRNSRVSAFRHNTRSNLRLALVSMRAIHALQEQTGIQFGNRPSGSLKIFRDSAALDHAWEVARPLADKGLRCRRLTRTDTLSLEPALLPIADQFFGAIHFESDEIGDAYRFCVALAEYLRRHGVEFRFNSEVKSLEARSGQVSALLSENERFIADRYVVAAGSYSMPLLRHVGIELPVRPAKGYSVTLASPKAQSILRIPVVDDQLHAAIVPLNGAIRIAGTAEFAGFDRSLRQDRIDNLVNLAQRILPRAGLEQATRAPWCGLRPMSADGVPIIGSTTVSNLWINSGHGHLGWTMAAGSAQLLADLMCGSPPPLDPSPYALGRFFGSVERRTPRGDCRYQAAQLDFNKGTSQ